MISAEARGKRRLLINQLKRMSNAVEKRLDDPRLIGMINRSMLAGAKGRERAAEKIAKALPGVRWHKTDGTCLIGAFLAPGPPVINQPENRSLSQTCIAIRYAFLSLDAVETSLWTLEIPEHAVGRIIERSRVNPVEVIFSAHNHALVVKADREQVKPELDLLLPAADGYFVVQYIFGRMDGWHNIHLRASTFLDEGLLMENQSHPVMRPGEPNLGESLLLPHPLRSIRYDGTALQIACRTGKLRAIAN